MLRLTRPKNVSDVSQGNPLYEILDANGETYLEALNQSLSFRQLDVRTAFGRA